MLHEFIHFFGRRWDLAGIEQLPDCMKVCFKALYDTTNEFALRTHLKTGWNPISSLIKSVWKKLFSSCRNQRVNPMCIMLSSTIICP